VGVVARSTPLSQPDAELVAELLGRAPRGAWEVAVRDAAGVPVVIRNHPLLDDGTPMPTRYWLVSARLRRAVDRLEAAGGVRRAEAAVEPGELLGAHRRYAEERDRAIPPGWAGPRPAGGVGGTRRGVKCLHAHYAWYLAGGEDPVGAWVQDHLVGREADEMVLWLATRSEPLDPGAAGCNDAGAGTSQR
jgi:hypothetical protein